MPGGRNSRPSVERAPPRTDELMNKIIGIIPEVSFGQTAEARELRVVRHQKVETSRYFLHCTLIDPFISLNGAEI